MTGLLRRSLLCATLLAGVVGSAHADRRYFLQSYTPYVAPKGNLELEVTSIAKSGQGDSTATAWGNRIEFEYGLTDKFTGAAYLNFVQDAGLGAPMTFDGPSLEFIYRLADPGKLPVDPAAYLEIRANGGELELEPKLILGRRIYQLVAAVNVIGEFEKINAGEDKGTTEKNLIVTGGLSREIGHAVALGLEVVYTHGYLDEGPNPTSVLLGPTINYQTPKLQFALGWHPQISGSPASSHGLNLADFPRSEVRLLVGVEL
jgi:hypothetical protein